MQITLQQRGFPLQDNRRKVFDRHGNDKQDGFLDHAPDQRDPVFYQVSRRCDKHQQGLLPPGEL